MSQQMLGLFDKYKDLARKRDNAWGRVHAAPTERIRQKREIEAKKLDKQLYNITDKINKQADAEGVKYKRQRRV